MKCYGYHVHSLIIGTAKSKPDEREDGKPVFYYMNSKKRFWDEMPFEKKNGQQFHPCEWESFIQKNGIGFADLAMDEIIGDTSKENKMADIIYRKLNDFFDWIDLRELNNIGLVGLTAAKRFFVGYYYRQQFDSLDPRDLIQGKLQKNFSQISESLGFNEISNDLDFKELANPKVIKGCNIFVLPHVSSQRVMEFNNNKDKWYDFWQSCKESI
jgi:hypothetical protein